GWITYAFPTNTGSFTGVPDYDNISISSDALIVTYRITPYSSTSGTTALGFYPADQMAIHTAQGSLTGIYTYVRLTNADGSDVGDLQPSMHHDGSASSNHYAVGQYSSNHLTVFAVTNPLSSSRALTRADVTLPAPTNVLPASTTAFRSAFTGISGATEPNSSYQVGMYLSDGYTQNFPMKAVARSNKLHL